MTQARYIDEVNSIASRLRPIEMEKVLQTISQNYIGNHPTHPAMCRVSRLQSIKKLADHTYTFPIDEQYPDMKESETVYAWGMVWANQDEGAPMKLSPIGPTKLYVNGECVFGSANEEELEEKVISLNIKLSKGWNHFILQLNKQENRVGAIFGAKNRKNKPYHFLVPSLDRRGEEGWIHTQPINELDFIPRTSVYEKTTNVEWFPEQIIQSTFKEKFAESHDVKSYAWTQILQYDGSVHSYTFEGKAFSPFTVYINQEVVHKQSDSGPFTFTIENNQRTMDLLIESFAVNGDWGFLFNEQSETPLTLPRAVKGGKGKWLYMGSFPKDAEVPLYQEGNIVNYLEYKGERFFWQTNQKDAYMRLFLENEFFGKWNYPLGVTLYGLLEFSKEFNQPSVFDYVKEHVDFTVSTFKYSLADKELFGAAGINNQLSDIDSLDDCGSFGALMLLADKEQAIDGSRFVADYIADYIMHKQSRLPDDTLYRKVGVSESMHMTMWIDDLYMSIPFLCRYAEISKDDQYLKEAAKQLLLYKKHLFLDELNLMSHVYHVEKEKRTNTVWGRGNGWVIFSLAELLKLLPNEFEEYRPIKEFYLQMVEGILAQQGESGLWHQVLSDHQSYAESSCTSIFIYALSTGIRQGWIERKDEHIQRLTRAWEGLCHQAIDQNGNIHGICKGSSYGFSHDYYKYRLGWKTNDPHGIGIVLLAGTELYRMLQNKKEDQNKYE